MKFTAKQIALRINGTVVGDPEAEVTHLAKIEEGVPGALTFISNPKYIPYLYKTSASVVVIHEEFDLEREVSQTLIKVADPYSSFSNLLSLYDESSKKREMGVHASAVVHPSVVKNEGVFIDALVVVEADTVLGKDVQIYATSFIGKNVSIGENTVVHPGAKILSNSVIGNNCIIHSGVIVGSDGFGFAPQRDGRYDKIPQTGNVVIGDRVEIGANSTIDAATLGSTVIGDGVKIDNLVQIAHNVEIKPNTVIAAQSGIAGSTRIGKNCMIGGQVGVVGHITVGDFVRIQAQSGVSGNVPNNSDIQGTPAFGYRNFSKSYIYFKKLPNIEKRITEIENVVFKGEKNSTNK